jgi:hypothetical protein
MILWLGFRFDGANLFSTFETERIDVGPVRYSVWLGGEVIIIVCALRTTS